MELTGETAPPSGAASYHHSRLSKGNLGRSRAVSWLHSIATSPHLLPRLPGKKITLLKLAVFTSSEQAENKSLMYVLDLRKPGLLIK